MMKIYILILVLLFASTIGAQVGINTNDPLSSSTLHIRSSQSTSGNYENDLIINNKTGYIGLGTSTPQTQVDVMGNFRFSEKSPKDYSHSILATDTEGNASWKDFNKAFRYKSLNWNLLNNTYPDITTANNIITLTGTTDFDSTIDGASSTDSTLSLPKGRYYITINAGLSNATSKYIYQIIKIFQGNDILVESYYFNSATSLGIFIDAEDTIVLSIQIEAPDLRSDPASYLSIADAFPLVGPNKIWANVNVLTLDITE